MVTDVQAAQDRGIQIEFELDLPAHSLSWALSMPEIMSRCPEGGAYETPVSPISEKFYAVYEGLVKELASAVDAPQDAWIHLGADEAKPACWESDPAIAAWMARQPSQPYTMLDLYAHFERRLAGIARKYFGHVALWEDAVYAGVKVDPSVAVQRWFHGDATLQSYADQGHLTIIDSEYWHAYLDHDWRWEHAYVAAAGSRGCLRSACFLLLTDPFT